jgi:hypothetical protein
MAVSLRLMKLNVVSALPSEPWLFGQQPPWPLGHRVSGEERVRQARSLNQGYESYSPLFAEVFSDTPSKLELESSPQLLSGRVQARSSSNQAPPHKWGLDYMYLMLHLRVCIRVRRSRTDGAHQLRCAHGAIS